MYSRFITISEFIFVHFSEHSGYVLGLLYDFIFSLFRILNVQIYFDRMSVHGAALLGGLLLELSFFVQ